jgi:hypothetical protein
MAKIIFNFLISPDNKRRFEMVCASKGQTMSGTLNGLIESYVIDQTEILEHRTSQFQRLDAAIEATQAHWNHHQSTIEPDFDDGPISPIYHDGSDFYDHNF